MVDKRQVATLLSIYKRAWEKQDPELIITIFAPRARYYERAFQKPFTGHKGIQKYWVENVVKKQKDIHFEVESIHIVENIAFVDWTAHFYSKPNKYIIKLKAIMELTIDHNGKIVTLKEYWHSLHLRNNKIVHK